MLKQMRDHSRSIVIWLLFGIIIVSFVVTFGPASMRLTCGGPTKAGTIAGRELSNADVRYAFSLGMPPDAPPTYRAHVLDQLLQRELLAQEGRRMGIRIPEEEIVKMITKRRECVVLGMRLDLAMVGAWPTVRDRDGKRVPAPNYYHDQFKRWVQYRLRMKTTAFMEQQRKELTALKVAETIQQGVIVTEREARAVFEYQNHSLDLEFARFKIDDFKVGVIIPRAKIMTWLASAENRKKVDKRYKKNKWKYEGLAHERRVRHLLLKANKKATAAERRALRQKLARWQQVLKKSPTEFGRLAQAYSEDEKTRTSGGDLGWREQKRLGFGKAFAEAVFKLQPGVVSDIIESDEGLHLVLVEADRKGDVTVAQARPWIAEQMLAGERARAEAKRVAQAALGRLLAGKTMQQVFPSKPEERGASGDKDDKTGKEGEAAETTEPVKKTKPVRWHPLLPEVEQATVMRSDTTVGQIGKLPGLIHQVWQLTDKAPVLGEVLYVPGTGNSLGSFVVVRLKSKNLPDPKEFERKKDGLIKDLLLVKRDDALRRFVYSRCEALRTAGEIKLLKHVSQIVVWTGKGENRQKKIYPYVPCQRLPRFGQAGASLQ